MEIAMRKIKLRVEALHVESFETTDSIGGGGGTVRGHQHSLYGHLSCYDCATASCSDSPAQCYDSIDTTGQTGGYPTEITCQGPGCLGEAAETV
jgi:hypothetical protein